MEKRDQLEVQRIAALCLDHLAEDPEELARFMEVVGYSPSNLRAAIGSRELDVGLIDYYAGNEPLLLALCANAGITTETFMRAWAQANPQE